MRILSLYDKAEKFAHVRAQIEKETAERTAKAKEGQGSDTPLQPSTASPALPNGAVTEPASKRARTE